MHFKEAKGLLSSSNGMNIFRGCTHGCIYCDSRSRCYRIEHVFEDIEVKINAPELLERALKSKREPCMIGTGAMCDPYMPIETKLGLMRKCLEIIADHGFGLAVQTKSSLIKRDLDLLTRINNSSKCVVQMTLTTFDETLCSAIEPDVSGTKERFETLNIMRENGIPTVVWLSPLLPFINDTEENLRGILDYCFRAGVRGILCFGIGMTLREGNREYFYKKLDERFPGLKEKYQKKYGYSYEVVSDNNDALMKIFHAECEKRGVMHDIGEVFKYLHMYERKRQQLSLF